MSGTAPHFPLRKSRGLTGPQELGDLGLPKIEAGGVSSPRYVELTEHATDWVEVYVDRPSYLVTPGGRRELHFRPNAWDGSVLTDKLHYTSLSGVAYLFAPGFWYVHTPVVAASGTAVSAVVLDAHSGLFPISDVESIVGQTDPTAPLTMLSPVGGTVGTSSATLLSARAGRRFVVIENLDASATIFLAFGEAAQTDKGIVIPPSSFKSLGQFSDYTEQEIRGISTAASTKWSGQEGT